MNSNLIYSETRNVILLIFLTVPRGESICLASAVASMQLHISYV